MRLIEHLSWVYMSIVFLEVIYGFIQNDAEFWKPAIFIIGTAIVMIILQVYISYYNRVIAQKGNHVLYERLNLLMFKKAIDVELACYENPEFYKRYTRAASQTKGTALKLIDTFARFIAHTVTIFYVFIKLLANKDIIAIMLSIFPLIITYILQKKINLVRYKLDTENMEGERKKEYVNRTIYQKNFAKEIRMSNIHNVLFKNFSNAIFELISNVKKFGMKLAVLNFLQGMVSVTVLYTLYSIYAVIRLVVVKNIDLAGYVILVNTMMQLNHNLGQMTSLFARLSGFSKYIDNLKGFLQYESQISQSQDGAIPEKSNVSIKFENVSFKYNKQSEYVLKNISMEIKPKQKIALVGHNGAGKSTLIKLLMRLYDVDEGEILLNNINIKDYNVKKYRDLFGVVFQDYKVMSMSVAENVLMGNANNHDKDLIENSLKLSGVYDKVKNLKNGINTTLTKEFDSEGAVLSGGEVQKIAIARMFAKDATMAVLDEPSSALDPVAEYQMYESMMKACANKTVIFISHRMSSAVLADQIFLLENGEIIEKGSHQELLNLNGKYAEMFRMQAEGYKGGDSNESSK